VTVDLKTVPLPRPFMLMATQNPIELEGPSPAEAQLEPIPLESQDRVPTLEEEAPCCPFSDCNPLDDFRASWELQKSGPPGAAAIYRGFCEIHCRRHTLLEATGIKLGTARCAWTLHRPPGHAATGERLCSAFWMLNADEPYAYSDAI